MLHTYEVKKKAALAFSALMLLAGHWERHLACRTATQTISKCFCGDFWNTTGNRSTLQNHEWNECAVVYV